ncbi:sensor domain-containing diguanylate cyclase [Caldimonas tepidiphila]|uniref:sensor domain-containing diguanylate cyclase n=1 Tax=Caldimonas tepidiphila TaxID=2315841 RepID=UPI000E5BC116|nr:diguanylate cyclase [Caldimonas tepidiphila]
MFRSFRFRLTLSFGLLAAAIVAALAIALSDMIGRSAARDQGEALQTLARSIAAMMSEGLHERMREVELLAASPEVRRVGTEPRAWRPVLERMQRTRSHFAWIGVSDAQGRVRAATGGLLEGEDVSHRPWFQAARSGPFLGDVHKAQLLASLLPAPSGGEPLRFIDFAAPLHDAGGRLVGVLAVHGSWEWARDVIALLSSQRHRERGVLVFVVDAGGQVIHHPSGPEGLGGVPPNVRLQTGAAMREWRDGRRYLSAAAPVIGDPRHELGWTVVVRQPEALALEAAADARLLVLLAGGLAVLLTMAGSWWVAAHVSRPLRDIARAAQRIEAGERDTGIPVDARSTELQHLGRALQAMTCTLVAQRQELEAANRELEQRVRQRTEALERANAELERLARRDPLTGLGNRRVADEALAQALMLFRRHGRPASIALVDVDHFKQVNDSRGHAVGDRVLVAVAALIEGHCRASDLVARIGGEEFLVLMPETAAAGGMAAAEKIRQAVAQARLPELPAVTVSVGLASLEDGTADADALLRAADEALYAAKRAGRNRVVHAGDTLAPA